MSDQSSQSRRAWEIGGILVPAGLFLGLGIGWLFMHLVKGLLIGLGAWLLAMAVLRLAIRK